MHVRSGQYNKSLELSSKIRKREIQADLHQNAQSHLTLNDIKWFFFLGEHSRALNEIDSLLLTKLDQTILLLCLYHKGLIHNCMRDHHAALSAFRDVKKRFITKLYGTASFSM